MTFDQAIAKPYYEPIVLLLVDDYTTPWTTWVNYNSTIWYCNKSTEYELDGEYIVGMPDVPFSIVNRLFQGGVELIKVYSIADMVEGSYFDDVDNNNLYVYTTGNLRPSIAELTIGVQKGYKKGGSSNYIGEKYFSDQLKNIPSITKSKSDIYNSKIVFEKTRVILDNSEGDFDTDIQNKTFNGKNCQMYLGFDGLTFSEYKRIYNGFVESSKGSSKELELSLKVDLKQMSKSIPENLFTTTTYPNLDDTNNDEPIPLTYGVLKSIPVVCTNENEGGSSFSFKLCDTTYHAINAIDQVYVGGVAVSHGGEDLTNATFTLTSAQYEAGDEVTADIEGYTDGSLIENTLDIIADLLNNHYDMPFSSALFNTLKWDTSIAYKSNLFLNSQLDFFKAIEKLTINSLVTFLKEDDGRWSARIFNSAKAIDQIITKEDIIEYVDINDDIDKSMTSVTVNYNPRYSNDKTDTYIDTTQETTLFAETGVIKRGTYNTSLTDSTEATEFTTSVLELYGGIYRDFALVLPISAVEREIGDIVRAEIVRPKCPEVGTYKCEVVKTTKKLDNGTVMLTLRPFEQVNPTEYEEGSYWGDTYWGDDYWSETIYREVTT